MINGFMIMDNIEHIIWYQRLQIIFVHQIRHMIKVARYHFWSYEVFPKHTSYTEFAGKDFESMYDVLALIV